MQALQSKIWSCTSKRGNQICNADSACNFTGLNTRNKTIKLKKAENVCDNTYVRHSSPHHKRYKYTCQYTVHYLWPRYYFTGELATSSEGFMEQMSL